MFIFGEHKLSFYISIVLWSCSYDVFYFSRDFLGGAPSSWFSTLPSFGGHEPCKCGHKFFFFTWPRDWCVKWLCGLSPLILSHHLAKFGVHRPCGSGDKRFLFVTWPRYRSITWLVGWGPLILNTTLLGFGVTGNNSVCSISSNSNAEVYKWSTFSFFKFKFRTCSCESFSLQKIFSFYRDNVNQLR